MENAVSGSQEEKLQCCHFARESEVFPGDTDMQSSLATGIIMVSMPETESSDYQTPPEHHLSSQTQTEVVHHQETGSGEVMVVVVDDSCERMADSDHLQLLEDNNNTLMVEVEYANAAESCGAEAVKMPKETETETAPQVFVEMPVREEDVINMSTTQGNAASLNKLDGSHLELELDCKGKRRLPFSIKGIQKSNREKHDDVLTDCILNRAWKILVGQGKCGAGATAAEDDDFLQTAKRRGLTFPRPRWWPPEEEEEEKGGFTFQG